MASIPERQFFNIVSIRLLETMFFNLPLLLVNTIFLMPFKIIIDLPTLKMDGQAPY